MLLDVAFRQAKIHASRKVVSACACNVKAALKRNTEVLKQLGDCFIQTAVQISLLISSTVVCICWKL